MNEEQQQEAVRLKSYFPYRLIFFIKDPNTQESWFITKYDKRAAMSLARKGMEVSQVQFN